MVVFFFFITAMPFISHAQVMCTGLGDNKITIGGSGSVSVECSKYETPGGGATKFTMPDGTTCSFENLNSSQVACGSPQGNTPLKKLSQNEFGVLIKSVQDAFKGGSTHSEISQLIHNELVGKQTFTGADIFGSAFGAPLADSSSVNTTADHIESVYNALLSITQDEVVFSAKGSVDKGSRVGMLAIIGDTQQWILTDRPLEEVLGTKKRLAYPGLPVFVSSLSGFSGGASREPERCDIMCLFSRAQARGDVTPFDVLLPLLSAVLAGLLAAKAHRLARVM